MADYKTQTPKMMGQFFSEVNSENFEREKDLYEECHGGPGESIEVIFFRDIPGKCAKEVKEDGSFSKIKHFNFADYAVTTHFTQRQLLVTVQLQ